MNTFTVTVQSINQQGLGIAKIDNKVIMISGGVLPNEVVIVEIYKITKQYDLAALRDTVTPSIHRVIAKCPSFGICGGCSLQHYDMNAQINSKQQSLIDDLQHIGNVQAKTILPIITGNKWHYRHKARLSVKYVYKKNSVLIGFHEKKSHFVTNMNECCILPVAASNLISPLRALILELSIKDKIPQIELAVDNKLIVLIVRIMADLNSNDEILIKQFIDKYNNSNDNLHQLQFWLQPKGLDSIYQYYPLNIDNLSYELPEFNLTLPFLPHEFTQVNPEINQKMVSLAIKLLDIKPHDYIADLFCGIGNFTLAIANYAKHTLGIEGNATLVNRAKENAKYNQLESKVDYQLHDLFVINDTILASLANYNKWLIDPARSGAFELVKSLLLIKQKPEIIVYVSCNPASLARDSDILVNQCSYTLANVGIINMFPHTNHTESIALFNLSTI